MMTNSVMAQDAVVFLIIAWKPITDNKWITGCQVGDHSAKNYRVKLIGETPKWQAYPYHNKINHEKVLVDCFDVPDERNGINGYLFYKKSLNSETERVEVIRKFKVQLYCADLYENLRPSSLAT